MIKLIVKSFLFGAVVCCSPVVIAQTYQWSSAIDTIREEGFYKLLLTQDISSKSCKEDLSDIRIVNDKNNEIPYLIKKEPGMYDKKWFKEYPIVSKQIVPNKHTSLVIHNPLKNSISNFSMVVKNNDAYKFSSLSGSDDKINWYFITADYPLSQMYDAANVATEKIIYFPLSNYEFYKLDINDSATAPLNVLKIGNYKSTVEPGELTLIKPFRVDQKDSLNNKKTYVTLDFGVAYQINKLKLFIDGPKFYKREVVLYSIDSMGKETYWNERSTFYISSNGENAASLPSLYGTRFVMVVDNDDNQPVHFQSVEAYQRTRYLVASLNNAEVYHLLIGNKKAPLPQYDLSFFADSIPVLLPEIHANLFSRVDTKKSNALLEDNSWFKSKVWIWAILAIVVSLLIYVSYKMIGEMGKKEKE